MSRTSFMALIGAAVAALIVAFASGYGAGRGEGDAGPQAERMAVRLAPTVPAPEPRPDAPLEPVENAPAALAQTTTSAETPVPVSVEPTAANVTRRTILKTPPRGRFGVQVGAFPTREEAERFAWDLTSLPPEVPIYLAEKKIAGKGTWYRVRLGRYSRQSRAERLKKKLPAAVRAGAMTVKYR